MKNSFNGPESLESIMARFSKSIGIDRGMKEIALVNMWPDIVGKRFKDKSKAFSLTSKGNTETLVVAVSSSSVSQELFLFKADILKKLNKSSQSLGFNITDIVFSTKFWEQDNAKEEQPYQPEKTMKIFNKIPLPTDLETIELPASIISSIKSSVESQNFSDEELKTRMINLILKDIKLQIWRKNNGFPSCQECGITLDKLTEGEKPLCPSCKCTV